MLKSRALEASRVKSIFCLVDQRCRKLSRVKFLLDVRWLSLRKKMLFTSTFHDHGSLDSRGCIK